MPNRVSLFSSAASFRIAGFALGLYVVSPVFPQSVDGSIYGQTKPGVTVSLTNLDSGTSREITSASSGNFYFAKLPPGLYRVVSSGVSREVGVVLGTGSEVNFHATLGLIEVTGQRTGAIDMSSVESTVVFTQAQLQTLPVARDITAVALLAAGVIRGDPDFGGLPSFAGASVAENGYYINGFDVTNIRNFLSYASLPFDAIEQHQIKKGGYGAEYGRSLGGVISVLTKRGTNEWKMGGAMYTSPQQLRATGKNVLDLEPTRLGNYTIFTTANSSRDLSYNVYAGGPIIKDSLFVFLLVDGKKNTSTAYGQSSASVSKADNPNGLLKLDWQLNSNHALEFTGIHNHQKSTTTDYVTAKPYSSSLDGVGKHSASESGGGVVIGKYTGHLSDNLTVATLVGKVDDLVGKTTGARLANQDCPVVLDVNLSEIGCWAKPFPGAPIRDPAAPDDKDNRKAWRVDLEWALSNHTLRAGFDSQEFVSASAGANTFSGGYYYRYFITPDGTVNGVANRTVAGGQYVRRRLATTTSGKFGVDNRAYYIEDSWHPSPKWLLYGGLRSESFDNQDANGLSFVKASNLLAPRLGFAWDAMGDATLKVFGNAGSYFIPVASNTNIRATRGELFEQRFFLFQSRDPRTQAPVGLSAEVGQAQIINDGKLPNPATIASTNLRPMSQNEFIFGFQKRVDRGMSVGLKGTYRTIKNGFDDFCGTRGALERWAADNRFTNFDASTASNCIMLNPGRDVNLQVDVNHDGALRSVTIPSKYFGLPTYKRTYEGIELSFEQPLGALGSIQGSYTWSKSRGNAEGYVNSTINQTDAGITQDFDFASFTHGAEGYLPNDRRHVFKLFGSYLFTPIFRVGINTTLSSGRPRNCIGFVPPSVADYDAGAGGYVAASSFYCLNAQGVSVLTQRGSEGRTPWTNSIDVAFTWTPKIASGKVSFQADVFNLLNRQRVLEFNEIRDFSRATSITPPGQLNQNYGQPTSFESPRSVRLTARYEY